MSELVSLKKSIEHLLELLPKVTDMSIYVKSGEVTEFTEALHAATVERTQVLLTGIPIYEMNYMTSGDGLFVEKELDNILPNPEWCREKRIINMFFFRWRA